MILNLDDKVMLDIDKVSMVLAKDKFLVVDGVALTLEKNEHIDVIAKAFKWQHQGHTYDKELKREGGK